MKQTFRDPKSGKIYTEDGQHIADMPTYSARVRAGEISGNPLDISQMPQNRRTETGGIATMNDVSSQLGSLGKLKSNQGFLERAKDIIQRKQMASQPLTEQKAYWRGLARNATAFGSAGDPYQSDERMRLLSPTDQSSIQSTRYQAAQSHLQGIAEEEAYRGQRIEDTIKSLEGVLSEKNKAEQDKIDNEYKRLQILGLKKDLGVNPTPNELGVDISSATVDQIANAIKTIESGGNYNAKGASGESGAYQFMPRTWASWSSQYANEVLQKSSQDLPMTPENQDAVAKWKIKSLVDRNYTPEQIASIWNSGSPEWKGKTGTNAQGVNYDVPGYVNKFSNVLGQEFMTGQTIEHQTWTEAAVRALALVLPGNISSTELWNNYTDAQLDEMSKNDASDVIEMVVKKIPGPALLRIGLQQQDVREILTLKAAGVTDDQIKSMMKELDINPTKYDDLIGVIKKIDYTDPENKNGDIMALLASFGG